jgi:hypothetical protein
MYYFQVKPLDLFDEPNDIAPLEYWEVTQDSPVKLTFQLLVSDALPLRRFMVPTGQVVKAKFQRAKVAKLGQTAASQTFEVQAIPMAMDRSIWTLNMTAEQINLLVSGTVQFNVYNGNTVVQTINAPYMIKKILTGAGC